MCVDITRKCRNKRIQGSARNQWLSLLSLRTPAPSHCIFLGVNLLPLMNGHWSPCSVVNVPKRKGIINCFREFPLPLLLCWSGNIIANPLRREPLTTLCAGHFRTCSSTWIKRWATLNTERASVSSPNGSTEASPDQTWGKQTVPFACPPC